MVYRTLIDVYSALTDLSPARGLAKFLGLSPQGLRHKCVIGQFFTVPERDSALAYLDSLIVHITNIRDAIGGLPCRVDAVKKLD